MSAAASNGVDGGERRSGGMRAATYELPTAHGVSLLPLNSSLDMHLFEILILGGSQGVRPALVTRPAAGSTCIRYDAQSGRTALCRLTLDASCAAISWQRVQFDLRAPSTSVLAKFKTLGGFASLGLDEGWAATSTIKSVDSVDSYEINVEASGRPTPRRRRASHPISAAVQPLHA